MPVAVSPSTNMSQQPGGQHQSQGVPNWSNRSPVSSRDPWSGYGGTTHGRSIYSPAASPPPGSSPRKDSTFAMNRPQSSVNQPSVPGDQEFVEHAGRLTDHLMNKDLQYPTLYQTLVTATDQNLIQTGIRPVSGFMDHDYPPVVEKGLLTMNTFSLSHNAPIPHELNEMLNQDVGTCQMGIFPEICRAWMTIDSDLYLWDFRDGSELSFYDGLKETILTMALVEVKPNVFKSTIQYLLVISTASEIVILGFVLIHADVSMSGPVMELVSQPIFVVSTEGVSFTVIEGTNRGRIFLGALDGSVHEVHYQAGRGWIRDRCWKTNLTGSSWLQSLLPKFLTATGTGDPVHQITVDNTRNLVFTRSASGALQAFDMGNDGSGFSRLGYISFDGLINSVLNISKKTLEATTVKQILTISPIEFGEINLVAVADTGTRLYFSCYNPPQNALREGGFRPSHFHMVHVRLPPGYCPNAIVRKPTTAHYSYCANGMFAMACQTGQDEDSLWLISPFLYPTQCFSEVSYVNALVGTVLDIKSIPCQDMDASLTRAPDVVTQHLQWQRQIVVLTPNGSFVYRAAKPFELLKDLMANRNGTDSIRGHYDLGCGREQPLANTVLLAIHPFYRLDNNVYDSAIKAFFMYGNNGSSARQQEQPNMTFNHPRSGGGYDTTLDFNPNIVSTPTRDLPVGPINSPMPDNASYISPPLAGGPGYSFHLGQQQMQSPVQSYQQQYYQQPDLSQWGYSPRHDALYLVVGRILCPFWNRRLVQSRPVGGPKPTKIIIPNISGEEVSYAITFLHSVHVFITNNPSLYLSRGNVTPIVPNINAVEGRRAYSQELEKTSITALKSFLSLALEVLGMWKILCDHQFHIVLHGVDNHLHNATMRDLVVNGHGIVSVIINALISKYLGDNAAVDAISLRLREVCPTLFKNEDAIGSKVAEILSKVKNATDNHEREVMLKESLSLCEQICGHGRVNIKTFCMQYADLGYPVGAVRLCVCAARAIDPEQLALAPVKSQNKSSDPAAMHAFQTRAEIYGMLFEILNTYQKLGSTKQSPLVKDVEEKMTAAAAQQCADDAIQAILSSEDEVFHIHLYNWLIEKKLFDRLLQIKHPFLDSFLQLTADAVVNGKWSGGGGASANDTGILDLLWRHHERNQNHVAAAQILGKLSDSTTTGLNLQQRLEYLSRAVICAKSCFRRGDLLDTIEDKIEVAQIQKSILDAIMGKLQSYSLPGDSCENIPAEAKPLQDAISKLNGQLYNITSLYSDFANPFKLHEARLEIFHSAGHGERTLIEGLWSDIVEAQLSSTNRQTMESQMEIIRRKLVSLGRKYITSPTFFPLEYLVEHLESMKPNDSEHIGWVFKTMLEVGVPFPDLLLLYERLWRKISNRQPSAGVDTQVAKVIILMVDMFAKQELELRTGFIHRAELAEKCKDLIATMIVEFSSRFDSNSNLMTQQLNLVKDRLDRARY